MHKLQLALIVFTVVVVGCQDKNPVGPGSIETLTRPPNGGPTVVVTGPTDGSNLSAGTAVVLSGTANDAEDGGSAGRDLLRSQRLTRIEVESDTSN